MNSSLEDRLRGALAEAGETVRAETVAPLRSRRRRVRPRWAAVGVTVAAALMLAVVVVPRVQGGDGTAVALAPPREEVDLAVFLCRPVADPLCDADERVGDIETALRGLPGVDEVHFEDRQSAYEAMRSFASGDPDSVEGLTPDDLPQAFRLVTRPDADIESIARQAAQVPGVADVVNPGVLKGNLPHRVSQLAVFLCQDGSTVGQCEGKAATKAQKEAISRVLKAHPDIQSVAFEDQEAAFENFRKAYVENEALVSGAQVSDMPESFRAVVRPGIDLATRRKLLDELEGMPGVSQVVDQRCLLAGSGLHARFGIPAAEIKACE